MRDFISISIGNCKRLAADEITRSPDHHHEPEHGTGKSRDHPGWNAVILKKSMSKKCKYNQDHCPGSILIRPAGCYSCKEHTDAERTVMLSSVCSFFPVDQQE